jgi:hypothetical protein
MKGLIIILSSTWKFAATFPVAVYLFNMSFFETIFYTNLGGLIGIVAFTFFSKGLIHLWEGFVPGKRQGKKQRKVFTKRNRRLVIMRTRYGLPGIVFLTPVLLSIPIGTFLITKYYGSSKKIFFYFLVSNVAWSLVYTLIYMKVKTVI